MYFSWVSEGKKKEKKKLWNVCCLSVNTFLCPPPQTCFLTFGHILDYKAVLSKMQNFCRFCKKLVVGQNGGSSWKLRCTDEGNKPGVFGLACWLLRLYRGIFQISHSFIAGTWVFVDLWETKDKVGSWECATAWTRRRGRAVVRERTEILEVHSRKNAAVYWQALCVNHWLAVWCVYHLLLSSNISYSVNIHYHIF